jgi:hypothetical protein
LRWANGDSGSKAILLRPWLDEQSEADESFRVTLSAPSGGATLGNPSAMDVTIVNVARPPSPPPLPPPSTQSGGGSGGGGAGGAGSSGGGASGVLDCLLLGLLLAWFGDLRHALDRFIAARPANCRRP